MPSDRVEKKSCCTWPIILVTVVVVAVSSVLIWRYAPIDKVIDNAIPTFNNTGTTAPPIPSPPASSPTASPVMEPRYEFNRCQEGATACCNGLESNCDLGVDEILFATVHNAMATFDDGFLFGPNHQYKLEESLEAGFRGINLDVCNCNGSYQFCHGVCDLGARDIVETLTSIDQFLDDNPNEVITVPLELNSEVDQPIDIDVFYTLVSQVPGFLEKIYVHNATEWPTLREVIAANKRVLVFHHRGPDCSDANPCPPGFHFLFQYTTQTNFGYETEEQIKDTNYSCALQGNTWPESKTFFLIHHYVTPPKQTTAATINALGLASQRLQICSAMTNLDVNFLSVDFWSEGDIPQLTQETNAARAIDRRKRNLRMKN